MQRRAWHNLQQGMDAFHFYSLPHVLALLAIALLTALFVQAGRRLPENTPERFAAALAVINLILSLVAYGWWLLPPQLDYATTLPLQLCHLTALVASAALLTRRRSLRALLYFWGFGLSTQALLTPSLGDPPSSIWFWAFWAQHGFIVAAATYDIAVRKFRPSWRDYWLVCRLTLLYALAVSSINLRIGANYGFVGNSRPETPSIIDLLGPWPQRLVVMVLIAAAAMALLMLPWAVARRCKRRTATA